MGNLHSASGTLFLPRDNNETHHSHHNVVVSTRSEAPLGTQVVKEIGVVSGWSLASARFEMDSKNDVPTHVMESALEEACAKCSQEGGNALLAMHLQYVQRSTRDWLWRTSTHATGTCCVVVDIKNNKEIDGDDNTEMENNSNNNSSEESISFK